MKHLLLTTVCALAFTVYATSASATTQTPGTASGPVAIDAPINGKDILKKKQPVQPTTAADADIVIAARNFNVKDGVVLNSLGNYVAKYDPATKQYVGAGGKIITSKTEQELFKQVYKAAGTPVDTIKVVKTTTPPKPTTPTATVQMDGPTGVIAQAKTYTISSNGYISDASGKVVGHYIADSKEYVGPGGAILTPNEKALFKQVVTNAKTAPVTTQPTPGTAPTTTLDPAKLYSVKDGVVRDDTGKAIAKIDIAGIDPSKTYTIRDGAVRDDAGKVITKINPTAVANDIEKAVAAANANPTKAIGEGYIVNAAGDIFKTTELGKAIPIAKLDSAGDIVSLTDKKLEGAVEDKLKKLMKDVKLPIGLNGDDRTDSRITQKNTYVAESDDGNVYYGQNGGTNSSGGADGAGSASSIIKAAEDTIKSPAASTLAKSNYVMVGDGQIRSADGVIIGRYVAATNTIVDTNGATLTGGDKYELIKAVVARTQATTPVTSPIPGLDNPPASFGAEHGWNPNVAQNEWNLLSASQKKAWIASHPVSGGTPGTAGYRVQRGTNQIVNPNGVVVGVFDPATGKFFNSAGAAILPSDPQYAQFKAALATRGN